MIRARKENETALVRDVTKWLNDNDLAVQWRPHFLPNGNPPRVWMEEGHDGTVVFGFKDHRLAIEFKLRFR
jgi:hypothetical protein